MRFVLDEASWAWDGVDPAGFVERLEEFLDRLDVARERDEPYAMSSVFWERVVFNDVTLHSLIWDADSPLDLDHDLIERFAAALGGAPVWDAEADWAAIAVTIGGTVVESVSAAHAQAAENPVACIALPGRWSGPTAVEVGGRVSTVHFVVDETTHRGFFREVFGAAGGEPRQLVEFASHAFPDIHFLDDVWQGLRRLDGGYTRVKERLLKLLAVLDDFGGWIFTDDTGRLTPSEPKPSGGAPTPATSQIIQDRFSGWGLSVAPEKPDVRANKKCREARERTLGGRTLYCEWHYKFEPHINRAHLHGPVEESEHKVVFAILAHHLPLP